jgi:hypothetical protein
MTSTIEALDRLIKAHHTHAYKLVKEISYKKFELEHSDWDSDTFYAIRELFFHLATGDQNFQGFYNSFDAPGHTQGRRPIAWGPRFLPDLMDDQFWSDAPIKERMAEVERLYKQCIKVRKAFEKKKKNT